MVTPIYAALIALMLIGLSVNVIIARRTFGIGLGDRANIEIYRRIRAQANFAEYSPLFIIVLSYAELGGLTHWSIHAFGAIFLLGRLMHAYSLLSQEKYENEKLLTNPTWRIRGMICTFATIGCLSIILLVQKIL